MIFEQTHTLIHSMDKAEKRNFKLYVKRLPSNSDVKFIELFELLNKQKQYNDKEILRKLNITSTQLSNLKRHLYTQILKSLRLISGNKEIDIQLREQIDFARILYSKGQYLQALRTLEKARKVASEAHQNMLSLEIIEFEKLIESRHITRSRVKGDQLEILINESSHIRRVINLSSELVNLNLKIHGLYIKMGHVKSDLDMYFAQTYFESNRPYTEATNLSFIERIYLHMAYITYHHIRMDFDKCRQYAEQFVGDFHSNKNMIIEESLLYLRGLHYLLTSLFYEKSYDKFMQYFEFFEHFKSNHNNALSPTASLSFFIYYHNAYFNHLLMKGDLTTAIEKIPEVESLFDSFDSNLDHHRKIHFYYKFAWLHFSTGDYNSAIDCTNKIINSQKTQLRVKVLHFAQLLQICSHFSLGHYQYVGNKIPSLISAFKKINEYTETVQIAIDYIKKSMDKPDDALARSAINKMKALSSKPYEKRSSLIFDFESWLESRISLDSIAKLNQKDYLSSQE